MFCKRISILIFTLIFYISANSQVQQPTSLPTVNNINGWYNLRGVLDSMSMFIERDTNFTAKYPTLVKATDHNFYYTNGNGNHWYKLVDTAGHWISSGWLPTILKYYDTASMLSPYARNNNVVHLTGNESIGGNKTFSYNTIFNGQITSNIYGITINNSSLVGAGIYATNITANRTIYLPDNSGTFALTSDTTNKWISLGWLPSLVKYSDTSSMLSGYKTYYPRNAISAGTGISYNPSTGVITNSSPSTGGTVTSVATNNNTGITGGTITTSGTLAIDTTVISTRLWRQKGIDSVSANVNLKVNISDTANMLANYRNGIIALNADTVYQAAQIAARVKYTDTSSMLSPYQRSLTAVKYSDTASMLANYRTGIIALNADTVYQAAQIAARVKYTDTASMLNNYLNGIIALNADTIYQAAQIAARVKYSDTAAMLAPYTRSVSGGYLPLSGGTLTGNLNGTTANFTGFVAANGFQSAVTGVAGGSTTNMTSSSSQNWYITSGAPTTTTIVLPNATTIAIGNTYQFNNNATGGLAIQQYGGGALYTVPSGGYVEVILLSNSFSAGQWDVHVFFPTNTTAGTAGFSTTGTINSSGLDTYTSNLGSSYTSRTKVDKNYVDSSRGVDVKYSDTASMLNNYRTGIIALNADTATIQPRFNNVLGVVATKVNYTDTASMLNNYRTGIVALNADTATIQPRFNNVLGVTALKVNYTDTASMLAGYKTFYPRNAISLTTTGTSGAATYTISTGVLNIPQYQAAGTYVTSVTGTSPISSSGGTTPAISISQATTSSNGYLSSTDWNTFNNKQNALTNPVTGTGTTNYITKWTGTNTVNTSTAYDDGTGFMVNTTTNGGRRFVVYSASADNQMAVTGVGPSIRFADNIASPTYSALYGMATQSNNYITGAVAGDFAITWNSANNLLLGYSNTSTEKARLTSSGNFLINTQSDAGYKLQVNGTGYFTGTLTGTSAIFSGNVTMNTNNSSAIKFTNAAGSGTAWDMFADNLNNTFFRNLGSGSFIFTNNSTNFLTIASTGAATFSSSVQTGGNVSVYTGGYPALNLGINSSNQFTWIYDNPNTNLLLQYNGSTKATFTSGGNVLIGTTTDNGNTFQVNGGATFGGNVGIGTTSPAYTLDVNGTGRFSGNTSSKVLNVYNSGGAATFFRGADGGYNGIMFTGDNSGAVGAMTTFNAKILIGSVNSGGSGSNGEIIIEPRAGNVLTLASTGAATFSSSVGVGTSSILNGLGSAIQVGTSSTYMNYATQTYILNNYYYNSGGSALYNTTNPASSYVQANDGSHHFYTASSGTAGTSVSGLTDRLTITNAGNVGIGTTSPSYKLVVSKGGAEGIEFDAGTIISGKNYLINYNRSTSAYTDFELDANNIIFSTAGSERMRITSGGNVGIGTTSPTGNLTILAPSSSTALSLLGRSTDNYSAFRFQNNAGTTNYVTLYTNASDFITEVNGVERMRINNAGNTILSNGSSSAQNATSTPINLRFNNDYSTGYTDASLKLYLFNSGSIIQGFTSGPAYDLQYHSSGSSSGRHAFYVANSEIMRINGSNVLIGTTTDNGYKFQVYGTAWLNGAVVNSLGTGTVYSSSGFLTNTNPSDIRLKNSISPLNYGLDAVMKLNTKQFYYNSDANKENLTYGLLAQEVQKIIPEIVKPISKDSEYLGIKSENLVPILINAIQELEKKVEDLQKRIKN